MNKDELILEDLYNKLEQISDMDIPDINIFPSIEKSTPKIAFACRIEYNSLTVINTIQLPDSFKDKDLIKEAVEYLENRIEKTSNNFLKAKYNHFLYILTKNNIFSKQAIDKYYLILSNLYDAISNGENINDFVITLRVILQLTEEIKYETDKLKERIIDYLSDKSLCNKIKLHILNVIHDSKIFKSTEISDFPSLCLKMAKDETNTNLIENLLELGLHFARRISDNKPLIHNLYEALGDNEYKNIEPYNGKDEDMAIAFYNQNAYSKMMVYYKQAKNEEKYNNAARLYNLNKKNLKLLTIKTVIERKNSEKFVELINQHFDSMVSLPTDTIVFNLCLGKNMFILPNKELEELANENAKSLHFQYFGTKVIDINDNSQGMDVFNFCKFQVYGLVIKKSLDFAFCIILKSIELKKLSYAKFVSVLNNKTFFGQELTIKRISYNEISYTWMSQIDFALKSFFNQCKLQIKGKTTDWRTTIDILSLRFEGFLRDIINISSGGSTVKINSSGDTSEMMLDDLLRSDTFSQIFNEDDKNLFFYAFTDKGLNIRNYVAHAFYKPQHYIRDQAVLVLLCVLRLAKFIPKQEIVDNNPSA